MTTRDTDPNAGRQPEPNFNEPDNPLRHYAGVLRRRARISVICLAGGLLLGLVASFFIKQEPVTTRYYKAVNTLVMSGDGGSGTGTQGYTLERAKQLVMDQRLIDVAAKKVGWGPVVTGHHLAANVRGEQFAIDVVGIAQSRKTAEQLADTAASTLARMADEEASKAYQSLYDDLTKQQEALQKQLDALQDDSAQAAQQVIVNGQLSAVKSQLAAMGDSPSKLGLATAQEAHAIEINKAGYQARLDNAINLPGQYQQGNQPVTPSDQLIDETDLSRPTVPSRIQLILIGGAIGLAIGIVLSFIIEAWDDKVRSRARVESLCDLPVLAEIPNLNSDEAATHAVAMVDSPKSPIAERYRATCTAALFSLGESATERPLGIGENDDSDRPHAPVILVTSPNPSEGKTTTSANLAAAFADTGRRVLAVDADFRRPALAKFLAPVANLDDPHAPWSTRIEGVSFLAAPHDVGAVGDTVFELRKLIAHHQNQFDIVIVDTPPMLTTNDAIDLLAAADATLLVLRAGRTRTNSAQRAATVLSRLRADVLGVVLNGCDRKEMENYYGYGYGDTYYYYGDSRSSSKKKRRSKNGEKSTSSDEPITASAEEVPVSPN
ncbi:MAG TPA: P-loop NTPase [Acidimicrobiales bacterium]|nr:P-loop NTPase [Acidimicrobiales bacterium]